MKQYFKKFEDELQVAEEKLDILSEWHISKGHITRYFGKIADIRR